MNEQLMRATGFGEEVVAVRKSCAHPARSPSESSEMHSRRGSGRSAVCVSDAKTKCSERSER